MSQVQLTYDQIEEVKDFVANTAHAQQLRRALAILWLWQGDTVQQVADRLCVSRTTVYNWAARFQDRGDLELADRMADGARSGRPRKE